MNKKSTSPSESQPALGVLVTPRRAHGMLLRPQPGLAPEVVRRFTRIRTQYGAVKSMALGAEVAPDDSAVLTIGDAPVTDGLFMASEFGDVGGAGGHAAASAPSTRLAEPFASEVQDLLTECKEGLHLEPVIGLVMDGADVQYAEVRVPDVAAEKDDKRRARMLALLAEQIPDVDGPRVVFVPMTPAADDATPRFLAVAPRPDDASTRTLRELRQMHRGLPPARLLDTEVTLLYGLARAIESRLPAASAPESAETRLTLFVRPGTDDTLVMALRDGQLHHYVQLRSLTAFDAPETLCSRILLQQDEHGLGEVGRILVLSEANEGGLVQYLGLYYPDADVRSCREALAAEMLTDVEQVEVASVAAYAAALRLTGTPAQRAFFPDVNLLPATLLKRRVAVPFSWHIYALAALLFVTVFFFTARYVVVQQEVGAQRARVAMLAPERAGAQVATLQAEIDSLQRVTGGYLRSLEVLDSLLVGSDRWSRALEQTTRVASSVRGIWVESWADGGSTITLSGNATSRDRVVRFADMIGGDIASVSFSEIRDFPVYAFSITVPLTNELPAAAQYLRDQVAAPDSLTALAPVIAP